MFFLSQRDWAISWDPRTSRTMYPNVCTVFSLACQDTLGGGVRGGLITFLGLDMGRNHQGRNFYFFSLLLELLIVHSQSCFEDLSHCIRPAFFGVVAAQPVSCTLKLGPICWHVCPEFWYSSPLKLMLRQQTSMSWSVHWNMLGRMNLLKQWNRRPIKFEVTDDASDAPLTWTITWYTYTNLPNGCMQTWLMIQSWKTNKKTHGPSRTRRALKIIPTSVVPEVLQNLTSQLH